MTTGSFPYRASYRNKAKLEQTYSKMVQNRMDLGAKKNDFEALFDRNFTRKITSANIEKSSDKSLSQP